MCLNIHAGMNAPAACGTRISVSWILGSFMAMLQASLGAQLLKNLPAMQKTQVRSLGWEDPLEEGMATHFNILAWEIPWTEQPGRLRSMGLQESDTS